MADEFMPGSGYGNGTLTSGKDVAVASAFVPAPCIATISSHGGCTRRISALSCANSSGPKNDGQTA